MASVTWATFKAQIARKLDDTSYRTYSEDLLLDAVNDALEAFAAAHTGVASDIELTGDGTTYEFDLPGNIIEEEGAGVYAVHWEKSTWLTRLEYWPGKAWPNASRSTSSKPLGYILWPQGKISFSRVPTASQTVTIHYVAYYAEVVDDDSTLTVPRWARSAIKHFVCAEALEPGSAKASKLGQYKSKRESGGPEDNPLLRLAEHYMQRYYEVLAAHQPPQYAKLQPNEARYYK